MVGSPSPVALTLVFCFAIPLISFFAYYLWFAEFERMVRAGRHLQRLEFSINTDHFDGQHVLTWESELRTRRLKYPYVSGAALFLGVALFSPFVAVSLAYPADSDLRVILERIITRDFLKVGAVGVFVTGVAIIHSLWRHALPRQQDLPSRNSDSGRAEPYGHLKRGLHEGRVGG